MFETKPEVKKKNIFDYVAQEETAFLFPISVYDSYEWGMMEHIKKTIFYKNSQFTKGANDGSRPFKNIIRPLLNLQYRAEDIDVKDIILYIDDPELYYLSFLVKKYHDDVFIKENNLDSFIDEFKEEQIDFGGALAKDTNDKPEIVHLQTLAFCDQTDILSAPFAIKHFFNPNELLDMADKGWGNTKNGATADIQTVILSAENSKKKETKTDRTTGKYIEVYEVHGVMPESYLNGDGNTYSQQMHIIVFNTKETNNNSGSVLYAKEEKELPFKFLKRDPIYGRTLGMGGVEELFEDQVWTNYSEIRMKDLLDAAAKTILKTTDKAFANRNRSLKNMENLEITVLKEGTDIGQIDTFPRSIALFERAIAGNQEHAQRTSSATDPLLGESPNAGTPFRLQERVVIEGKGLHEYRRGKYAKFLEEVYTGWILPRIAKKITQGSKFLSELSMDEMEQIGEQISENLANKQRNEQVLNGQLPEDKEILKQRIKADFYKKGSKQFIEILKGELKNIPLKMKVNISGKQKDLAQMTDKITNIFRFVFSNPQGFKEVMQMPGMSKIFSEILEYSGFSPISFGGFSALKQPMQPQLMQPMQQMPQIG